MPDNDFKDILETLAADVSAEAKVSIEDARRLLSEVGPLVLRWEAEAREADAAGDTVLAVKKRASILHVRHAAVLDIATHATIAVDKVERAVLAAFDRAISLLP